MCLSARLAYWKRNDYTSKNISLDSSSDEEEEEEEEEKEVAEEEEEGVDIRYMVGDVTRPQCAGKEDAIVVHCVGKLNNTKFETGMLDCVVT